MLQGSYISLVLAFILLFNYSYGQKLKYNHYSIDEGLRHNIGYDIMQDSKGYLWIGTDDGLSRYDGTEFKNYTKLKGLTSTYIIEIAEGTDEMVWVNTFEGKLIGIEDDKIHTPKHEGDLLKGAQMYFISERTVLLNKMSPKAPSAMTLCDVDTNKVVCKRIGLYSDIKGNVQLVSSEEEKKKINTAPPKTFTPLFVRMYKRKNGQLLLATSKGIFEINSDLKLNRLFNYRIKNKSVYGLTEDVEGNLWAAGEKVIYKIISDSVVTAYAPSSNLKARPFGQIRTTKTGKVFVVAGWNKKLYRLDTRTFDWMDVGNAMNMESTPSQIEIDLEQNVWVTSDGGGLYCIFDSPFINYTSSSGLGNSFVYDLHETKEGKILAGTKAGVYKLNQQNWEEIYLPEGDIYELLIRVRKISKKQNDEIYASTSSGFYHIKKTEPVICLRNETDAASFVFTSDNKIVFLKQDRLVFYDGCGKAPVTDTIPIDMRIYNSVNSLFCDSKDRIWIATDVGVIIWENGLYEKYDVDFGIPNNQVNDIKEDSKGYIWIATEGGLCKYKKDEGFINFNKKNSPISDIYRKILIDNRDLIWTASPQGLHIFSEQGKVHNVPTGVIADDINCLFQDSKENLWIGTSQGISMIDNSNPPDKIKAPDVLIQNISINNSKVSRDELKNIPYDSKLIFNYSALAFTDARKLQYQYRINESRDWQTTKNRSAEFTDLREGNYNFQLQVRKFNSSWSKEISLPFTITPPWYRETWFLVALGLLILMLVAGIMYSRIRSVEREEKEKTEINKKIAELELNALQSQMNPHFIFNSLNAIQHFVMSQDVVAANQQLSKFGKLMRMYLESSKNKFISLNSEIELIKLYVGMEQLCYEDEFDFELKIDPAVFKEDIEIPTMLIQPFVENAINHGLLPKEGKGLLSIAFSFDSGILFCTIHDNGIGRKEAMKIRQMKHKDHKSRGMEITNDRVQVLNYLEESNIDIDIKDINKNNGTGTIVTISFQGYN